MQTKLTPKPKPNTRLQLCPELYRAQLSAKVAQDVLDGKIAAPPEVSATDYALYNLAAAVADIAAYMERTEWTRQSQGTRQCPTN